MRYRGRRAATIENAQLRVTVLEYGGHIAEVFDKRSGVNPLWTPHWPSIEPVAYERARHHEYGQGVDASLLAGIMGHNLCLDIFGGPSDEEAAAGLPVHGEASTARFELQRLQRSSAGLIMSALLPLANLQVERQIELVELGDGGGAVQIRESVQNLSGIDRPVGWTEHVTLGPPFLQKGATEFRSSATKSKVFEGTFGPADYLKGDAEFEWPFAPTADGGTSDLRLSHEASASSAYTAHLMNPQHEHAFFVAYSRASSLAFGCVWRTADFPWMGIWEENHSRTQPPWNGATLTRGMEFGVSPFPESRREMIARGRLFGAPTFRWIPAVTRVSVEYWMLVRPSTVVPETLGWPEA